MKFDVKEIESAISSSSHSEFYLPNSGLNQYNLTKELNKLAERKLIQEQEDGTTDQATLDRMRGVLSDCDFPDFTFFIDFIMGRFYMQGRYMEKDTVTGKLEEQYTRKWIVTPLMTKSEIVQTAFKCILTSMEHRTREWFTYKEKAIFGPHFDVDALHQIAQTDASYDGRKK